MGQQAIPVIDIGRFGAAAPDDRAIAAAVDRACREIGFFTITGHGVERALIEALRAVTRRFFALPVEARLACAPPRGQKGIRGFRAVGDESLSYSLGQAAPPDLKETFRIGHVDPGDDAYARGGADSYYAPNIWPAACPGFRETWTAYYREMTDLAARLMRIFAVALELPPAFFHDKIDRHISHLQANLYPEQPGAPLPGQLRAGAHSDYGSLTILLPENLPGGLQVRRAAGDWIDVTTVGDDFVVNIGDLMAMWTNDRWVSTLHRVVNPPRALAGAARRLSHVFFHQPNYDADIVCLPSCCSVADPPRFAPTTSGAHLLAKIGKANTMDRAAEAEKVPTAARA